MRLLRKSVAVALLTLSLATVASAAPRRDDGPFEPVRSIITKFLRNVRRAFLPSSQDEVAIPKP